MAAAARPPVGLGHGELGAAAGHGAAVLDLRCGPALPPAHRRVERRPLGPLAPAGAHAAGHARPGGAPARAEPPGGHRRAAAHGRVRRGAHPAPPGARREAWRGRCRHTAAQRAARHPFQPAAARRAAGGGHVVGRHRDAGARQARRARAGAAHAHRAGQDATRGAVQRLHQLRAVPGRRAGAGAGAHPGHDGRCLVGGARAARPHARRLAGYAGAPAPGARGPAGQATGACRTAVGQRARMPAVPVATAWLGRGGQHGLDRRGTGGAGGREPRGGRRAGGHHAVAAHGAVGRGAAVGARVRVQRRGLSAAGDGRRGPRLGAVHALHALRAAADRAVADGRARGAVAARGVRPAAGRAGAAGAGRGRPVARAAQARGLGGR